MVPAHKAILHLPGYKESAGLVLSLIHIFSGITLQSLWLSWRRAVGCLRNWTGSEGLISLTSSNAYYTHIKVLFQEDKPPGEILNFL